MIGFAWLFVAAATGSHPVYLQCTFGNGVPIDIVADEANSAVTMSLPSTGYTEKVPAAFTATELRFQGRDIAYVINRTDLTARRTIKMLSNDDRGACKIQQAPKRAF